MYQPIDSQLTHWVAPSLHSSVRYPYTASLRPAPRESTVRRFCPLFLTLVATLSSLAHGQEPPNDGLPESASPTGRIVGRVTGEELGSPLGYVNLVATESKGNTQCGAMTSTDGHFEMSAPAGTYNLRCLYLGYAAVDVDSIRVTAGRDTRVDLALTKRGIVLSEAEAAAESLGADVNYHELDLRLSVSTGQKQYRRGDDIDLWIAIRNDGPQTVLLPRLLDGSGGGYRYPDFEIEIEGPAGGAEATRPTSFCGNMNPIAEDDLRSFPPGDTLFLRSTPTVPLRWFVREIPAPGSYTITVHFRMNELDVRKWAGWPYPGPVPPALSERLRLVPTVDLAASCEILVE